MEKCSFQIIRRMTCLFVIFLLAKCSWSKEIEPGVQMNVYRDSIHLLLRNAECEKATEYATLYFDLAKKEDSEDDYLNSLDLLFRCYKRQSKYSEVLIFLQNEMKWASENQKLLIEFSLKYYLGLLFQELNDNEKAIEYFLEVKESLDDILVDKMTAEELSFSKIRISTDLGNIMIFSNPDKTLKYFEHAKSIAQSINDSIFIGDSYLNIGWASLEIGNYEIAEVYLDSALVIYNELKSVSGRVSVYLEKGILLEHKGEIKAAKDHYFKSYNLLFTESQYKYNSYFLKQKALTLISDLYIKHNVSDSALTYGLEKLAFVEGYNDTKKIAQTSNKIAKLYEARNNVQNALHYYKLSNDNYEILKFEDARINVLKKESAFNQKMKNDEALELKSNLKSKNRSLLLYAFLLITLGVITILMLKAKRKVETEIVKKLKAKEDIIYKKTQSMAQLSLINQSKNQFMDYFKEKLLSIYNDSSHKSPELEKLIFKLKRSSNNEDEWQRFRKYYMELEPSFYNEIQSKWSHLTNLDIRHCILLKLKMSNNEASEILGVSPKSIQMARYRLKKKLNCDSQIALRKYLASI